MHREILQRKKQSWVNKMDTSIIIIASSLIFLAILFFVAELLTREASKKTKAKETQKEEDPSSEGKQVAKNKEKELPNTNSKYCEDAAAPEKCYNSELNQNNLANDIEDLLEKDKKNDVKYESASSRSQFANRSRRMKDFYERKNMEHEKKYKDYGIDLEEREHEHEIVVGDLTFTEEEIKKLVALQEVFKRKDS